MAYDRMRTAAIRDSGEPRQMHYLSDANGGAVGGHKKQYSRWVQLDDDNYTLTWHGQAAESGSSKNS